MPILKAEPSVFPEELLEEDELESGTAGSEDSDEDERRWWAVFSKSRQEKALARQLLAHQVPFYLPLIPKDHIHRGRRRRSYIPLFSNYLFLYGSDDERVKALTTNRVVTTLPVTDEEQLVADLRQVKSLIAADTPLTPESRLVPGKRVRIKSGAMQGVEGIVTARRGRQRLLIAVHFLQSGVSIEINDFAVEPL